MDDWRWMSAQALGEGIASGEIDPVALTETYLSAIDQCPEAPRIFTHITAERARAEAKAAAARQASNQRLSLLDGVPISWKDNTDSAGDLTEAGSDILKGRRAEADAEVLANATKAGLVCLGKTHMTELAFSGLGINPMRETPPNHAFPDSVPGGSSSGAAASLRYGLAACAIGTDTGGSIRLPAAWNDLCGFKPNIDDLPMTGIVPLAQSFDQVGPLARSVADAALVYAALSGGEVRLPNPKPASECRFAILEGLPFDEIEEDPMRAFETSVERLRKTGATVEPLELSVFQEGFDLVGPLTTAEAWANWGEQIDAKEAGLSPRIAKRFRQGASVSAATYLRGQKRLGKIRAEIASLMSGIDALILPSVALMPPNRAELEADADAFLAANLKALRNTRFGNMLGGPAMTLPTGQAGTGLMMLRVDPNAEALLCISLGVESALAASH